MLDIKSKLVLKILTKECPDGSYKIVESKDIISALPNRYKVDECGLEHILIYLERQEFISIKYDDEGVYCLCVLPYGNEVLETEQNQKRENIKFPHFWFFILTIAILSFFSGCLGSVVGALISRLL